MRSLAAAPNNRAIERWERNKAQAVKGAKRRRQEVLCIKAEDADGIGSISLQEIANEQRVIVVAAGGMHRGRIFWPGEQQG